MKRHNIDYGSRLLQIGSLFILLGIFCFTFEFSQAKVLSGSYANYQDVIAQQRAELSDHYIYRENDEIPRVSFDAENKLLIDILHQLAEELNVGISIKTDKIKGKRINYQTFDKNIYKVLNDLLKDTGLEAILSEESKVLIIQEIEEVKDVEVFQETIEGRVTDSQSGESLPGVNISVEGSTTGTSTGPDGDFELQVPNLQETLIFTYIGYEPLEVQLQGRTELNIEMTPSIIAGDEVVVVGYGTVRKANLTGSVSSVNMGEASNKTVSQASQMLAGEVSGITVTQSSGEPGADGASVKIRGLGTFSGAGTNPLYIIDGVPGDINSINPTDIENISVLKDAASAAIYGSRAANGVILIQTKEGVGGELQVNYESYVGMQQPTQLPQYVDSWTYAEMQNVARINMGQNPTYTQEDIDNYRSGLNPDEYPNKNHLNDLFNSGSGLQTKQNISFQGGSEETRYRFSLGYLNQEGIVEQNAYDRYDLLLSVNSQLRENLRLNAKLSANRSHQNEPGGIRQDGFQVQGMSGIVATANGDNATVPGRRSDGTYGVFMGHPSARGLLDSQSFGEERRTGFGSNISLEFDIIESLTMTGKLGYRESYSKSRLHGAEFIADETWSFGPSHGNVQSSESRDLLVDLLLEYMTTFGSHDLTILGGSSVERHDGETLGAYRENFASNRLYFMSAAATANDSNFETGSTVKLLSYFGRVNYSFQDKYLLEGNVRYDGSSRFAEGNRFGLFPSFSAGWVISDEEFFQIPFIDFLKIRAGYGILGNQQIGTYPYQKTLSLGSTYVLGESEEVKPGVQLTNLPFEDITWEETSIINTGIDLNLFEGKLNLVADYYQKKTKNILYQLTVSQVLGMSVGSQNAGEVENNGWEFELSYNDRIGDFSYRVSPNFSVNNNKVTSLAGVDRDVAQGLFIGESLQSIYGYKTDGLFADQADIDNYPTQNYDAKPGWPRYRDISGPDGVPDGQITSEYDRTIIGNQFPKYSYGMGVSANYKGFDFYMQLQGQAGLSKSIAGAELAFNNQSNIQKWQVERRWTPENPDRYAEYPRLEHALHEAPWVDHLEYWIRDRSFLRVKNIQLGYNIPSTILGNTFLNQFRIYVSGENVKTFDNYYPGWDPEMAASGLQRPTYYAITKMWSLGLNVQF